MRSLSEVSATMHACARRLETKRTPQWYTSYGHPSHPAAESPAARIIPASLLRSMSGESGMWHFRPFI
eukprot:13657385-Heterocapsa_arctica.AAC.1